MPEQSSRENVMPEREGRVLQLRKWSKFVFINCSCAKWGRLVLVTSSIFRPLIEGVYITSLSAYGLFLVWTRPVFNYLSKNFQYFTTARNFSSFIETLVKSNIKKRKKTLTYAYLIFKRRREKFRYKYRTGYVLTRCLSNKQLREVLNLRNPHHV